MAIRKRSKSPKGKQSPKAGKGARQQGPSLSKRPTSTAKVGVARKPTQPPRTTILHLSDIHRTNDEPVSNDEILLGLRRDIENWEAHSIPKPSFLVISGDITQSAETKEYEEAEKLIRELSEVLKLDPHSQLLVVPGNHDVHWPTSEAEFVNARETAVTFNL